MKVALITDTHFGARGDSVLFYDYMMEFYDKTFFPYLEENNITEVIHLGDVVDRRKYINFNILHRFKKDFIGRLQDNNINTNIIIGNHDTYFKNTNEINAMRELIDFNHPNAPKVHWVPDTIEIDGTKIFMLPWINSGNYVDSIAAIKNTEAKYCMGHLELSGFEMMRGMKCEDGMDMKLFSKFDSVFTGHFHHKSSNKNIHYLGNPYELTWVDYNDPRGFHIFDTDTGKIEFIKNPFTMFNKIWYDDNSKPNQDFSKYKGKYVKVIVKEKSNPYNFDVFLDNLYKSEIADLSIVEEETEFDAEDANTDDIAEDTIVLLTKYIDNYDLEVDKTKLKGLMQDLYTTALRGD